MLGPSGCPILWSFVRPFAHQVVLLSGRQWVTLSRFIGPTIFSLGCLIVWSLVGDIKLLLHLTWSSGHPLGHQVVLVGWSYPSTPPPCKMELGETLETT